MPVKLDQDVIEILCCPLCKGDLHWGEDSAVCRDCATGYPRRTVAHADAEEHVYDFRLDWPSYCIPEAVTWWGQVQAEYENDDKWQTALDDLTVYLAEIDSVREIYTEVFTLGGRVLDVGGSQGRLRHFLRDEDVSLYVSADPFLAVFQDVQHRRNLLKAYPSLAEPCNFLACYAEHLPFRRGAFDWVHMRSVLDHFRDPYLALKEAHRVLRRDGALLIGLAVRSAPASGRDANLRQDLPVGPLPVRVARKIRQEGLPGMVRVVAARVRTLIRGPRDHTFHWRYEDVIDLLDRSGFVIVKEHWQKPPYAMCVYLQARKGQLSGLN